MPLPAPDLDDRRFQDLVDDAKRLIQQRCPEWTDHNVSDPGVTLIEVFASMTDQLLYRLNRVPERLQLRFLDLVGVRLFPPTAARLRQTFWLSAAQEHDVSVPVGTEVATVRTAVDEAVVFTTLRPLALVASSLAHVRTGSSAGQRNRDAALAREQQFPVFEAQPQVGDCLYVGLTQAVPSCAVTLEITCRVEGIGVDPTDPPLVWEAWTGTGWEPCEAEDSTGGLNRPGEVVLHVPDDHTVSVLERSRAGWLRARLVEAREDQPTYTASPVVSGLRAWTSGGSVPAAHAERITDELLGHSEGVAGQRFLLSRTPVVPGRSSAALEVSEGTGWQPWDLVDGFGDSGPADRHAVLDAVTGELAFGPALREADGTVRQCGAVPDREAAIRMRHYLCGGGARGNVGARSVVVLRSAIPYVASTTNRRPGAGGREGEDLANALDRGPATVQTGRRAVTAGDFEHIAVGAAPEVARVKAVSDAATGLVRVLVVPTVAEGPEGLAFGQLVPAQETLDSVAAALDERRLLGTRISVEPPVYQGATIVARVQPTSSADPVQVRADALAALHGFCSPVTGGADGTGWPFGRPLLLGEVFSVLQRVPGVDLVEDVQLFPADPVTGRRRAATTRLDLTQNALVFGYDHQVRVL